MKRWVWLLFGIAFLGSLVWFEASPRRIWAEDDFSKQIAQILKNQEKMLQDLEEIKSELVKIRVRAN